METERDWLAAPLSFSWTIQCSKLVTALLSFDNRWANRFCHLTLSASTLLSCSDYTAHAVHRHPEMSQHNQLSDSHEFMFLNLGQLTNITLTVRLP